MRVEQSDERDSVSGASWGESLPAVLVEPLPPLPARLAELAGLREPRWARAGDRFPEPGELPEVQALAADGFRPLPEAPFYCGLPAVWPVAHRCWVPDRLPRVVLRQYTGSMVEVVPWSQRDRAEHHSDRVNDAAECGLPPPPQGRLWLVRSPWPSIGVAAVLDLLAQAAEPHGVMRGLTDAARDVLYWPEDEVWRRWSGPVAAAARAWREQGRESEDVAELAVRAIGPRQRADLPAELSDTDVRAWVDAVGASGHTAVGRINAWLAQGMPDVPPPDPGNVLATFEPALATTWLTAGFTLADIGLLAGIPLDQAREWRAAGFDPAAAALLLAADPTLTPAEALAFDEQGVPAEQRRRWIADGFSATEARGWIDLEVSAGQARVWRSVGHDPASAAPLVAAHGPLPPGKALGWFGYGPDPADRRYTVEDPPGTRGSADG